VKAALDAAGTSTEGSLPSEGYKPQY